MNGRTHFMLGLGSGFASVAAIQPEAGIAVGMIAFAGVCSLLPDIDHPRSIVSGWLPGTGLLRIGRHRGITHSLIALLIPASLWFILPPDLRLWAVAAVTGYGSHLIADMLTPEGIQLMFPLRGFWRIPLVSVVPVWIWESIATTGSIVVAVWALLN